MTPLKIHPPLCLFLCFDLTRTIKFQRSNDWDFKYLEPTLVFLENNFIKKMFLNIYFVKLESVLKKIICL